MHDFAESAALPQMGKLRSKGSIFVVCIAVLAMGWGGWVAWPMRPTANAPPEATDASADRHPVDVRVFTVEPVSLVLWGEATGHLEAFRQVELANQATGRVVARWVEEGQEVAQDAALLQLDTTERRIDVEEATAELLKARAQYAVSASGDSKPAQNLESSTSAEELLKEFQHLQGLHEQGLVADLELDRARRKAEASELLTGRRREEVRAATIGLIQAENRLERARHFLEKTELRAPFPGRIADLVVEVGQQLAAGETCLKLVDTSRMKVDVDVLEGDMLRLSPGAKAWVRVPALEERTFEGRVVSINPWVDAASGTGRVTVEVDNPDGKLLPGVFAFVRLEVGRLANRLAVPENAVLNRQGKSLVFRIEDDANHDGSASWTWVTTGARSEGRVEITEGLSAGDRVAIEGHFALAHDTPVSISTSKPPSPADGGSRLD